MRGKWSGRRYLGLCEVLRGVSENGIVAERNAHEHQVNFEEASEVFADANALSQFDTEHSDGEDRWITLGLDRAGRLLVVCHTFHEMSKTRGREYASSRRVRQLQANVAPTRDAIYET